MPKLCPIESCSQCHFYVLVHYGSYTHWKYECAVTAEWSDSVADPLTTGFMSRCPLGDGFTSLVVQDKYKGCKARHLFISTEGE